MYGSGFSKLRDLREALLDFRKSGKKVIAYGDDFGQPQYYLAAQADEVFLHPEGMVLIEGFGRARSYYKEGLDKFGIEVHVFRVGEYKSAVEPYLRDDMSKEAKEMALDTYGDLWRDWLADVGEARKIAPADIAAGIEALPDRLRAAHGDMALLAKEAKLVDTLAPRDEVRKRLIALTGEDKEKHSFKQIGYGDYLKSKGGDRTGATGRGKAVAVVVAKGTILDGTQPAGTIGGDSTARALAARAGERRREGRGAARRQPGRQRLRLRDHPPRVRARAQGRQAARRLDGQRGGLGRLLDLDRVRRDLGAARRRSRARSGSSASSPPSRSRSRSTSASTPTASAPRASATRSGSTARSTRRWAT